MEFYIKGEIHNGKCPGDGPVVAIITDYLRANIEDLQFEGGYITDIEGIIYDDPSFASSIPIFHFESVFYQMLITGIGDYHNKVTVSPETRAKIQILQDPKE
jgi:hypothetical protein